VSSFIIIEYSELIANSGSVIYLVMNWTSVIVNVMLGGELLLNQLQYLSDIDLIVALCKSS
jgi:hypothetical protein